MNFNLERDGDIITGKIKEATWFPFKSGHLRNDATEGRMWQPNTYRIHFDSTIAPYVTYLEEGTGPHDIPMAFGRPLPFGIGGRFDGKFHPGSNTHKGFISNRAVQVVIDYFKNNYHGELR